MCSAGGEAEAQTERGKQGLNSLRASSGWGKSLSLVCSCLLVSEVGSVVPIPHGACLTSMGFPCAAVLTAGRPLGEALGGLMSLRDSLQ